MKIFFILLLTFNLSAFAKAPSAPVMPQKWHNLWKLIDEEVKTITGIKRLSPRLAHRLIELHSEKIKLIRERENKIFFAASPADRKNLGRKHYFRESAKMHKEIKLLGMKLLRQYPQYANKAEVFYTLGLNERDYNLDKDSEHFLLQALRHAGGRHAIRHNSMTSLAEYYYNSKKYKKCLKYYDQVIGNTNDEWRTKHLYNMAWCHVKTNQYSKAIDNLKLTYQLILDSSLETNPYPVRYTDIGTQVLEAIGVFHILDKRPLEARDFFLDKIREPKEKAETLLTFARKVADKGFFPEAQEIITNALDIGGNAKHTRMIAEAYLFQLDFYRNFKREDLLFKTAQNILAFHLVTPLEQTELDQAVDRLQGFAGWLQERLAKTKDEISDADPKAERIIAYFDILAGINPTKTAWYNFYQGETLYVVEQDARASSVYRKSFNILEKNVSKEKEVDELRRKNMNALLSILERGRIAKKDINELKEYTYTSHLKTWPVDDTSRQIYGRLFALYLEQARRSDGDKVLVSYVAHYPADLKIQQDMMAAIMDDQIKKKDAPALSHSIKRLEKGFLDFDKSKINQAVGILGQLLFEETDKLRRDGSPEKSLEGLTALSQNETYPVVIRRQAAFTQAIVQLELARGPAAFEWLGKAIVLMDLEAKENVQEKKDPFGKSLAQMNAMSEELLLAQDFKTAKSMSEALLTKMCKDKRSEKKIMRELFTRSISLRLLEESKTKELIVFGHKCELGEKFLTQTKVDIYRHMLGLGNLDLAMDEWKNHQQVLSSIDGEKDFLVDLAKRRFWGNKETSEAIKVLKTLNESAWLAKTQQALKTLARIDQAINKLNLPEMEIFDQEKYNPALEKMLAEVQNLTGAANEYMSGEAELVLRAVSTTNKLYQHAANVIDDYTPMGVPAEFVGQFKGFMKQLTKPMRQKALAQSKQIHQLVVSGKLESSNSVLVSNYGEVLQSLQWSHPAAALALPMTGPVRVPQARSTASSNSTKAGERQ